MEDRRSLVLRAIIESFIASAEPVGSEHLLHSHGFGVSSATIRNDMAWLEREGFIFQPHTSAGRIPTDEGLRKFVDEIDQTLVNVKVSSALAQQFQKLEQLLAKDAQARMEEKLYYAVSVLARLCSCIAFATLPWRGSAYYLGLAHVLKKPEFSQDVVRASAVVEILEDTQQFLKLLEQLNIGGDVSIYIGSENILREMESVSLVATRYSVGQYQGVIGILGPKRMNYGYNIAALNAVRNDI